MSYTTCSYVDSPRCLCLQHVICLQLAELLYKIIQLCKQLSISFYYIISELRGRFTENHFDVEFSHYLRLRICLRRTCPLSLSLSLLCLHPISKHKQKMLLALSSSTAWCDRKWGNLYFIAAINCVLLSSHCPPVYTPATLNSFIASVILA